MILRHTFSPPNNARLANLCGPTDANLRTIEAALQVSIAHRHEQFKVDGPKAKAQRAMEVLQALYEIAARAIPPEKVQLMLAGDASLEEDEEGALVLHTRRADLKPRTQNQAVYLDNIAEFDITFGIGPAGTGKTYLAISAAVEALEAEKIDRIILSRPAMEAGESIGFLPGDVVLRKQLAARPTLDPERFAPYRSYAVLNLWRQSA